MPITVDKSHLITIGEQLYTKSIELIRELINNAYDADAAEVRVNMSDEKIEVIDNGTGMDLEGLKQYFNIGSPEKRIHSKSEVYRRERIGQFGIGKFATLSAGEVFEVSTQSKNFAATVFFDKAEWERRPDQWDLPLEIYKPDPARGDGTTITITRIKRRLDLAEVERCIQESVPIKAPHFRILLNGKRIRPREFVGHRIPFLEGTQYGIIKGEIYILPESRASTDELGIKVMVKQVMVKRDLFGMESWGVDVARIRGEVNADFLPITSDRSGFIEDREEYKVFMEVMTRILKDVKRILGGLTDKKETKKVRRALKDALHRIQKALERNPAFSPFGAIPIASEEKGPGEAGLVEKKKEEEGVIEEKEEKEGKEGVEKEAAEEQEKPRPKVKRLTPGAVTQRLRIGKSGVTCCLDHFGKDGPESFFEGTTIYINRDHPLYQHQVKKIESHTMHIARLMTQEISLMKDISDPRKAYERQSKLLSDAFVEDNNDIGEKGEGKR